MNTVDHCPHCDMLNSKDESCLGQLGERVHYKCRYCGGEWSWPAAEVLYHLGELPVDISDTT